MSSFDPASALMRYIPEKGTTTNISFTGTSSAYAELNATDSPRYFTLSATQDCYIVGGDSDVAAAASTDFLFPAGVQDFVCKPNSGIRVISAGTDGILSITPTGV